MGGKRGGGRIALVWLLTLKLCLQEANVSWIGFREHCMRGGTDL